MSMFQEKNINILTNIPVDISTELCPELLEEAEIIRDQFQQTLKSYGKIHHIMNGKSKLSEQQIKELGSSSII